MFISMAKWNQLSMTYVKEIARGLNITDLIDAACEDCETSLIKSFLRRPI